MNCSAGTCTRTAQVREPLPLCGTCALQVIANYAIANLAGSTTVQVREEPSSSRNRDLVVLNLYRLLNRRPKWTEVRDALAAAGLPEVSRPTAQRIRERVEKDNPALTAQPAQTATEAR